MPEALRPGSIVRCRNREWVLLPGTDPNVYRLRPLAGSDEDVVLVHRRLAELLGYELPDERVTAAAFPPPSPDQVGDATSCRLLWEAARLTLRDGAAPLRAFGRMSVRPRVYQLAPLLMALRLDPVRLLIADDVGVGKTIEALLIARELWDRQEIRSLAVLCPPYLCEQWEFELATKANLPAVIIRSGTVSTLERRLPPGKSLYQHYPVQVISIDWVKGEKNKYHFLQFCPELVIVDEVHGAAQGNSKGQQERHALLRDLAKGPDRHLILLTATPHSGKPEAFRSLLGLLNPKFDAWDVSNLHEEQRKELALHFVQRTRKDIQQTWEESMVFPRREAMDVTYTLSLPSRKLFEATYEFCAELVGSAKDLVASKQRHHHWAALGLLRCVMSSPAAALAALDARLHSKAKGSPNEEEGEVDWTAYVYETTDALPEDEAPSSALEALEATQPAVSAARAQRLRELARLAIQLQQSGEDNKLERCAEVLRSLLAQGFQPIVWCRYVATAEYVAKELAKRARNWGLGEVQVLALTGRVGDEERRARIAELQPDRPRILVATDCLSEGINLQELFTAVLHYDLPWNPNRLEQREGRVDRYGQRSQVVKAIRFYGADNPVDGAVLKVLIKKADEIRKSLGTHVPIPEETETLLQALLSELFFRRPSSSQLFLFEEDEQVKDFHATWDLLQKREITNRSRFAQRALKPEEVRKELETTDQVLGEPEAVRRFVLEACQRLGLTLKQEPKNPHVFHLVLEENLFQQLPDRIRRVLPTPKRVGKALATWSITFVSPSPEGAEYLGRNHPFVATLAAYLLETALDGQPLLTPQGFPLVARCGALRTRAVDRLTTLLLLRVRYLLELPPKKGGDSSSTLLAEEIMVLGFRHAGPRAADLQWLPQEDALKLFREATPTANIPAGEKRELVEGELALLGFSGGDPAATEAAQLIQKRIEETLEARAKTLEESHKNLRRAVGEHLRGLSLKPHLPPDLLGILVLQPEVQL
mgnify:CR=1 FL=1